MNSFLLFLFILLGMILVYKIMFAPTYTRPEPERKEMKLSGDQKRFLARWFHSQDGPDCDGYMGHYTIPESVMKVYRRLYPREWD